MERTFLCFNLGEIEYSKTLSPVESIKRYEINKNSIDEYKEKRLSYFKNNYIQQYENLPNAGDSIQKSFDKAYEKVAPFIMQGEKLTEIDRKGLMEMKKDGGAVGLNEGGDGFFEKVKQQFFKGQEYPYEVASEKPIDRGFVEDIEKATPEQTIAFGEALQLQGLDDYIDNTISQRAETIDGQINPNLSYNTQQYLKSRNTADAYKKDFTTLRKKSFACETQSSDAQESRTGIYDPICYLVFEIRKALKKSLQKHSLPTSQHGTSLYLWRS